MGRKKDRPKRATLHDITFENRPLELTYANNLNLVGGSEQFQEFWKTLQQPLPTTFRISCLDPEYASLLANVVNDAWSAFFAAIEDEDGETLRLTAVPFYPNGRAWKLQIPRHILRRPGVLKPFHHFLQTESEYGGLSRQEEVSMIPALIPAITSSSRVLDMCAAPGSKTMQLLERLVSCAESGTHRGVLVANESNVSRCNQLISRMRRLAIGAPHLIITKHEGSILPVLRDLKGNPLLYDTVICDAPCSGDGTLRKDIAVWANWTPCIAFQRHLVQRRLLLRAMKLVRLGGTVVYSVCSMNPVEGEAVVLACLAECLEFEVVDISTCLCGLKWQPGIAEWTVTDRAGHGYRRWNEVPKEVAESENLHQTMFADGGICQDSLPFAQRCIRILPHMQDTGGFFVAVLQKARASQADQKEERKRQMREEYYAKVAAPTMVVSDLPVDTTLTPPSCNKNGYADLPIQVLDSIYSFYGISAALDGRQFCHRTVDQRIQVIYFMSAEVRTLLDCNPKLNAMSAGVRALQQCADGSYRFTQDGADVLHAFVACRKVPLQDEDFKLVLGCTGAIPLDDIAECTRKLLREMGIGGVLLTCMTPCYGHRQQVYLPAVLSEHTVLPYIPQTRRERLQLWTDGVPSLPSST